MTRDDIVKWAAETGLGSTQYISESQWRSLHAFAELAAAAEREACAQVCEAIATETYGMTNLREYGECAAAIRERGAP
jgi:hypothetical protein